MAFDGGATTGILILKSWDKFSYHLESHVDDTRIYWFKYRNKQGEIKIVSSGNEISLNKSSIYCSDFPRGLAQFNNISKIEDVANRMINNL